VNGVDIKVWGDYACFTRPEFKVERVSYPVITPAAARGILEAIYWKPQIRYCIRWIGILRLGTQTTLLRNEISSRQSETPKKSSPAEHYLVVEDERQQRTSLVLQDVSYRIKAWIELRDGETNIGKHLDSLRRRVEGGQCHHTPYLGCREFAAHFDRPDDGRDQPDPNMDLPIGVMLFDTAYIEDEEWHGRNNEDRLEFWRHDPDGAARIAKGYAKRLFFNAAVKEGWLQMPREKFQELCRLEDRHGAAQGTC
jgi:CRISPR-associated protein Cas5d